jgi:eukaryotic-like serine/threonine-protein kinase
MMPSRDEIFLDAREISDSEKRSAYVVQACGPDAALRGEVEAMLMEAAQADSFFGSEDVHDARPHPLRESVGTLVGRYKLLEKIGEGGMGVVYMAEQREPVVRKVAFKIIKAGMDTRQVSARFEAERQALALMDHSNIAKVLDGGATETGRPYFVMDLVQGLPITQFCDEAKLCTHERLELFLDVCSAIQHAHEKGIIHRDIKPSNILVTLHGDKPVPKVIDFGIAKATQQPLTDKTLFTQFQHFLGTPAYMSPEQASLSGLDIDTRSDIYALGVLLYELLTSTTPFDGKELLKSGFDGMRRTIGEKEPMRPSTRLSTLGRNELSTVVKSRRTSSPDLLHLLRGDLDWIAMKCLEKDRGRRYETVNSLACDIRRFFNNEPVVARAPSAAYRLKKLVRRNKLVFSASCVVTLVLLAGVAVSSWQAVRANRERARAERRLAATLSFVESVFSDVSPKLQNLVGGAAANETLNTEGFRLMVQLQREAGVNPQFDFALGKLYTRMAYGQGWFAGNTSGNYDLAFNSATQAIHLFEQLGASVSGDERASRLARAEVVAGYSALALRRHDQAREHFLAMNKCATELARSANPAFASEGVKLRRWALGSWVKHWRALDNPRKRFVSATFRFCGNCKAGAFQINRRIGPTCTTWWLSAHHSGALTIRSNSSQRCRIICGKPNMCSGF